MPRLFMSIQDISLAHAGTVLPPLADTKGESSVARDIERATSLFAHQHLDNQSQDTSSHSQLPTATHVRIETKSLSRMCERRCLCQCHIPLKAATPRWLRNLMGTTFVNFTGAPLLNHRSCDFRPCANTKHGKGSVRLNYIFPVWLLRTSIKIMASWGDLTGVSGTWSLRVPRAITDVDGYNRLYRAVSQKSMAKIRREMDISGMRAYDYFLLDTCISYPRTLLEASTLFCAP
jgi:hypothetical protein